MKLTLALFLALAGPALAQEPEDEAHRADRLRTQELNSRSPNGYAPARASNRRSDRDLDDYADAQAEYRRRLDEWRRRVAACESGYYEACQR